MKKLILIQSILLIAFLIYSCSSDSPVSTFKGSYFQIMGVVDSLYAPAGTSAVDSSYLGHINYSDPDSIICTFDYSVNNWLYIHHSILSIKYGNCNNTSCYILYSDTTLSIDTFKLNGSAVIKNLQPGLIMDRDLYTRSYLRSSQYIGNAYLVIRNLRLYVYEN